VTECERVDRHDHDDRRLPEYFHAWLRGDRQRAPELRSWQSQRPLECPSGSTAGLTARRADHAEIE
jgi:hypothetical protein